MILLEECGDIILGIVKGGFKSGNINVGQFLIKKN